MKQYAAYSKEKSCIFTYTSQIIAGNTQNKVARMTASRKETQSPEQEEDFHWYCLNFF